MISRKLYQKSTENPRDNQCLCLDEGSFWNVFDDIPHPPCRGSVSDSQKTESSNCRSARITPSKNQDLLRTCINLHVVPIYALLAPIIMTPKKKIFFVLKDRGITLNMKMCFEGSLCTGHLHTENLE